MGFVGRVREALSDMHSARCRILHRENINEKSPYFRTSSHLEYGGEGGIDSLRSPCGQPVRYALRLSNWLSPVVELSVEGSHPSRRRATCEKKARIFMRALL